MFSDRSGFLLIDALISVFIVSLMSALVYSLCLSHLHVKDALQQKQTEIEQEAESILQRQESCVVCLIEETDP